MSAVDLSDPEVFSGVYERFRRHVWSSAWRIVRDHELADDVTQEVFAWLWTHPHAYDGRSPLSAYLALLGRTRAIDAWRTLDARSRLHDRLRHDAVGAVAHADDGVGKVIREDEAGELRALVSELTHPQREALVLAYWADLPLATIAARLGVPESTAKSRVRLARKRLSSRLTPLAA